MTDLGQYRKNAKEHNLCAEYTQKWDACNSNKQYFDMATDAKGMDYLCDSIAKGWGISVDEICERFGAYINARYVTECNGYNSCLYARYKGEIEAKTTLIGLLDCDVDLAVGEDAFCEVYCSGKCDIRLSGKGRAVFVCYGNEENITISGSCGNFKRINKKNRDMYEQ